MPEERDDEFGPWIEHDGHGFPVPIGTMVRRQFDKDVDMLSGERVAPTREFCGPLMVQELDSWLWVLPRKHPEGNVAHVVRYQVYRSDAVKSLLRLADVPVRQEVVA